MLKKLLVQFVFFLAAWGATVSGAAAQCDSGNGLNLFWRGGSGDFNDPTKWDVGFVGSGVAPCQVPRSGDNVTFPAVVFNSPATITVSQNASCATMYWEPGAAVAPTITGSTSVNLDIYNNFVLASNTNFNFNGNLRFKSVAPAGAVHDIQTSGRNLTLYSFVIEPSSDVEYRLLDELNIFRAGLSTYSGGSIFFNSGYFNTNANRVRAEGFTSITGNANRRLNIAYSQITVVRNDHFDGDEWAAWNVDFNRNLAIPNIAAMDATGSHILVQNAGTAWMFMGTGVRYDSISFGDASSNFALSSYVSGVADTFHYVAAYRRMAGNPWTLITDELHLYPNAVVGGTGTLNLTVDAIITQGGCGSFPTLGSLGISMRSAGNGWNSTISLRKLTPGVLTMQNLLLGRVTANTTGGRTYIGNNCADKGGNTNVTFVAGVTNELYFRDNANNQDWHTLANWERWDGSVFSPALCVPTPFDNVYFDNLSFPNAIKQVVINSNTSCKAMRWLPNVNPAAKIRTNSGLLNMFGTLEWSAVMTPASFTGSNQILLCSPNQDSVISNGAINNQFNIALENNADYHIHGNFTGRIWGAPGSQIRMAAHELRPFDQFNFSKANFNGTQIYTSAGVYNGCGTINYTGAAVWTFIPAAAGAVGYAWVCTLPEVILLANSKYYFYNGTIAVQGNLNIGEDARFMLGTPAQYSGSLNATGGLNGAAGNVTIQRGGELSYVNFNPTSSRINGSLNVLGDCQKTASIQTHNGLNLSGGFRVTGAVNITNAYIRGINNTSLAPNVNINALNSLDGGNNLGFTFTASSSQTYYWRALSGSPTVFAGNWATSGHWTTNPANLTGDNGCVPSGFDDVVFDNLSFGGASNGCSVSAPSFCRDIFMTAGARLVINNGTLNCRDLNISSSAAIMESFDVSQQIFISRNLQLAPSMANMRYRGTINFTGSGDITSNGTQLQAFILNFNNPAGVWHLRDALYLSNDWAGTHGTNSQAGELRISAGNLHTNSFNVTISSFFNASVGTAVRGLHLGNSRVEHRLRAPYQGNGVPDWAWNINPTNFTLTSGINAHIVFGPNLLYNGNGTTQLDFFMGNGLNYPRVSILENEQPNSVFGNTSYRYLELGGNCYIDGNNTMDSLRLEGGFFFRFRSGTTQTLVAPHGKIISNGTSSNFVNIESSLAGSSFILRKLYGSAFCIDFVKVKDCIGVKESNIAAVPVVPVDYQLLHPFLEFQTGVNSDNVGGTATGIWAFNLPVLVTPQYAGSNVVQPCGVSSPASFNIPVTGTGTYLVNYTWADGVTNGNNLITTPDPDNNSSTPAFVTIPIHSGSASITYTFNITTFRCGEQTTPITRNVTVLQNAPDLLTQTAQSSVCDFNNSPSWITLVGDIDKRPIVSLQDYTGVADVNALGTVTTNVFFDATVQTVNIGGFMFPYLQRHWRITPTSNGAANVRLYFTQAELNSLIASASTYGSFTSASQLQIVRYASGSIGVGAHDIIPYTIIPLSGATALPFSSTANVYAFEFSVPSFSHFILTPTNDVLLDNNLLNFTAQKQAEREILVKWLVAKSIDTDKYEIERSQDGVHGYTIGEVSSHRQNGSDVYTFIDRNPREGINYYRLRSIEDDGNVFLSSWQAVEINSLAQGIKLAPNPASTAVSIQLPTAAAIEVRLYNALGQIVMNQPFNNSQHVHLLDIHRLPAGVYMMQILLEGQQTSTQQLIKE